MIQLLIALMMLFGGAVAGEPVRAQEAGQPIHYFEAQTADGRVITGYSNQVFALEGQADGATVWTRILPGAANWLGSPPATMRMAPTWGQYGEQVGATTAYRVVGSSRDAGGFLVVRLAPQ